MTPTRYFLARVAQAFGLERRQRRMADAATESHLLREAEQILGARVWPTVEEVEELGIEYWTLRRLAGERDKLRDQLGRAERSLSEAHEQRAALLSTDSGGQAGLNEERQRLLGELDALARERDRIIGSAREVRRLYEGGKTKLEVLHAENRSDPDTVDRTRTRLGELRSKFELLRTERDEIAARIRGLERELDGVEKQLDAERSRNRSEAAAAFQQIGETNREISRLKAELGLIETRMQQLYGEIGRHVSLHVHDSAGCRTAAKNHRRMVEVMLALRKSIRLNQRLTGS